jgi:hypothetical protein
MNLALAEYLAGGAKNAVSSLQMLHERYVRGSDLGYKVVANLVLSADGAGVTHDMDVSLAAAILINLFRMNGAAAGQVEAELKRVAPEHADKLIAAYVRGSGPNAN